MQNLVRLPFKLNGSLLVMLVFLVSFAACQKEEGCTDPKATNYDASAEKDDGSCNYLEKGCTDPQAENYDSTAEINDGSCEYDHNSVVLNFTQTVDGAGIDLGQIQYENAAGNEYSVERLKYYISDVRFYRLNDQDHQTDLVHYYNLKMPETKTLTLDQVPDGEYAYISFVFGLPPDKNKTGNLPNTPENNKMEWPEPMGGGYHYMKFEGKFLDSSGQKSNFNCHTGRLEKNGQVHDNSFRIKVPRSSFTMDKEVWEFQLSMNLNEWFREPDTFDMEKFGPAIMGNQKAQAMLKKNGADIFTVDYKFKEWWKVALNFTKPVLSCF